MKFMIELETTVNTNFTGSFEFGSLFHTTSDMLLQHTCWCLSALGRGATQRAATSDDSPDYTPVTHVLKSNNL